MPCPLRSDWHPVAWDRALAAGESIAVRLFGQEVVVWRDGAGRLSALEDRCPHRGTRLSLGRVESDTLVCAYHAWRFDLQGRCVTVPAHPDFVPPARCSATRYAVAVHGGAIVVSLDAEPVDRAAASLDAAQRLIQCGPYAVDASAPRVIENFLDLSHLGFVHHGILGDRDDGRVHEYSVTQHGGQLVATGCRIRQPRAHADSAVAVEVDYVYRVLSPLMVQLEKHTADDRSAATRVDTIRLRVQPVDDTHSRAFIDMAISDHDTPEADLRAFQDAIFAQDLPILENQLPVRLPLDPAVESSMPSDRLSVAYRRYLNERGVETGVVR